MDCYKSSPDRVFLDGFIKYIYVETEQSHDHGVDRGDSPYTKLDKTDRAWIHWLMSIKTFTNQPCITKTWSLKLTPWIPFCPLSEAEPEEAFAEVLRHPWATSVEHPLEPKEAPCYKHQHLQAERLHAYWALGRKEEMKRETWKQSKVFLFNFTLAHHHIHAQENSSPKINCFSLRTSCGHKSPSHHLCCRSTSLLPNRPVYRTICICADTAAQPSRGQPTQTRLGLLYLWFIEARVACASWNASVLNK